MFCINGYKVRQAMKAKGLNAATLASRAEVDEKFIGELAEHYGKEQKIRDFETLVRLGRVLGVSPFDLI